MSDNTLEIIKSKFDKREYKLINTMSNKLDIILICDKDTDTSSACMCVNTGSFSEKKIFGLAHFLEHMLFMGSEKYPVENHYHEYLNKHGGVSNAYTSNEYTCYFFDILTDDTGKIFEHILDVFAHFFIDPLFNESSVDREINAVDSEHEKNKTSDSWRFMDVIKEICEKSHPISQFSTGSNETLRVNDILIHLKDFYKMHYSANK